MPVSVRAHGHLVDLKFLSVPTGPELLEVMQLIGASQTRAGKKVALLATITSGGMGVLPADARQVLVDHWGKAKGSVEAVAVIIAGDGVTVGMTRAFVRGLGVMLGNAWTVHQQLPEALESLAQRTGGDAAAWRRQLDARPPA